MNKIATSCFVDIKDSATLTTMLGEETFRPLRDEFLRVGRSFADLVGGTYIKSLGDAHLVAFEYLEPALRYATCFQEYYHSRACFRQPAIVVRIGLFTGVVEGIGGDVLGSGVNAAARVEAKTAPGEVWVNQDFLEAIRAVWGPAKADAVFQSAGTHELKGISPAMQELFAFDWPAFAASSPADGLVSMVLKHFQQAGIVLAGADLKELGQPDSVIWPVVPRDAVNAIHRGQLECVRLLAKLGWRVKVLIADCGAKERAPREYSEAFRNLITDYSEKRGLMGLDFVFVSDLFRPRCDGCDSIHKFLQTVIADMALDDLLEINEKYYSQEVKEEIRKSATLDFLRPALTIAAVMQLTRPMTSKSLVVVGRDEKFQWERTLSIPEARARFGVLLTPILEWDEGHQGRQIKNWPMWFSWESMADAKEMRTSNLAQWSASLHCFLPGFPAPYVDLEGRSIGPADWQDSKAFREHFDVRAVARRAFETVLHY